MKLATLVTIGFVMPFAVMASPERNDAKSGYWFYLEAEKEEEAIELPPAPYIPRGRALEALKPSEIQELINDQLDYALVSQTTEAVADYHRLIDLSRRRARGFAALTNIVLLENPGLNPRSAYPVTNAGRDELTRTRERERTRRLHKERQEFALIMFSSKNCTFCTSQWNVLQLFAERTGWIVNKTDIHLEPDKAGRFGVEGTPRTIMIRRNTNQWFTVAVGSESYPVIADNAYRGIRLLKGEITNQQFFNSEGDDGGFFDPTSRGLK